MSEPRVRSRRVNLYGKPPVPPVPAGSAGVKVTVACKMPNGLVLRLYAFDTVYEPVMGGGAREVQVARPYSESVTVRGNRAPYGVIPSWPVVAGFGLTHGVDKEFFDAWMEQNKTLPAVRNGLIFGFESHDDAAGEANNRSKILSGLEPIDPEADDRAPPGIERDTRG